MKKFWKIIGLVTSGLILGMILHNVHAKYLWQGNDKNDVHVFQDSKIEWKDENIELEIRMKLEKFNQDIYLSDIYDIRRLSLEGKGIYSIEDLSIFKNLVSLTLKDTIVEDLSPLTELHQLSEIVIQEGEQPVIDSLSELPELKRLVIYDSDINSITAVRDLKNLTEFYIGNCNVKDISVLGDLEKLETVSIQDCDVEDISALKKKNLYNLGVEGTRIQSIPILSKSIENLYLENNQIDDISGLKDLKNLSLLVLNNNKLNNLEPLRHLKKLKTLEIQNNCIQSIEPISNLPELIALDLCGNPIEDFSCIKLPDLEELSLSGKVKGEDLDFFSESEDLKSLTIVGTDLSNIRKPIPALPLLETVNINGCQLKSLDIFIDLPNLEVLNVKDNKIDKITALNVIENLRYLYLEDNQITVDDLPEKFRNSQRPLIDIVQDDILGPIPGELVLPEQSSR